MYCWKCSAVACGVGPPCCALNLTTFSQRLIRLAVMNFLQKAVALVRLTHLSSFSKGFCVFLCFSIMACCIASQFQ